MKQQERNVALGQAGVCVEVGKDFAEIDCGRSCTSYWQPVSQSNRKMIKVDLPYTGILFREIIILLLLHAIDNGLLCWQGCYLTVKSLNFLYSSRRNVKTHRLNTTITSGH